MKMSAVVAKIVAVVSVLLGAQASVLPGHSPFQQQLVRDPESSSDSLLEIYGFNEILRQPVPMTKITDCVFMTSEAGRYVYEAIDSTETVCGFFVFTEPDQIVQISFAHLDVPCGGKDLLSVVDGWELNGQVFPSKVDHPLPLDQRFSEFCGRKNEKIYSSSQNVALIQYRIPSVGKGFTVSVRFRENLQPCNVVSNSDTDQFTLRNYGRRANCTFLSIYPAVVRIVGLDVASKRVRGSSRHSLQTGIIHQCDKRGYEDQVQIGGTAGLDTSELELLDAICGVNTKPMRSVRTIACEVTTVRLVSSGKFDNYVTITARPADQHDILNADLTCGLNDANNAIE